MSAYRAKVDGRIKVLVGQIVEHKEAAALGELIARPLLAGAKNAMNWRVGGDRRTAVVYDDMETNTTVTE
jgi:hypothetical protein